MVGILVEPFEDENSANKVLRTGRFRSTRLDSPTDIMNQVTVDAELFDGHDRLPREKQHIPVVIAHIEGRQA